MEKAREIAAAYTSATGIGCCLITMEGTSLFSTHATEAGACGFCAAYQSIAGGQEGCARSHLYGSYQAERFGGSYIFFCPIGLVHWASPLARGGMMQGAILGGPVLMIDREEYYEEELRRKLAPRASAGSFRVLRKQLEEVPYKSPEEVSGLAEVLFMLAAFLAGEAGAEYAAGREKLRQESGIADYIQQLKTLDSEGERSAEYPVDKERELLRLISLGDKKGSQKILNEILGYVFFSMGGNIPAIKARVLELVVLLSRAAMEGGADAEQIFGLNFTYLTQLQGFKTVEDISHWLSRIMLRFTDLVFNLQAAAHVDVIYKAIAYIKRNYMKRITLPEVARFVSLSPSYFSKLFKDETGSNFNQFLNHVRIEHSKAALLDDSIPLVDIAFLMGFEEQSYFTKVFKKLAGTSPGRYRKTRGKVPVKQARP